MYSPWQIALMAVLVIVLSAAFVWLKNLATSMTFNLIVTFVFCGCWAIHAARSDVLGFWQMIFIEMMLVMFIGLTAVPAITFGLKKLATGRKN